ncbi:hypothetical protein CAPTEDRAFT_122135 [Capitella teleta]|uniref:F5/8 type C domain-containing protein n=1 Tax=Capitella teleta TaxID=283909 RepID=R7TIJ9_CAPTE|nr:hypothetical protein CAPTEDRAFT_122135 [Capitella teleta]|eukprot:ELT93668.1 hypothetical protein CAPTEDRAFT_122135 [Capitella teleta]
MYSSECAEEELISGTDHFLPDGYLTASSQADDNHGPSRSRLNASALGELSGGWVPQYMNNEQWIQVDFGYSIAVMGIALQGQDQINNFVTQFYVSYSEDLETWREYKDPNENDTMLFDGNFDNVNVRKRYFNHGFIARAVRLHPTAWNGFIAVRWELIGCPGSLKCSRK